MKHMVKALTALSKKLGVGTKKMFQAVKNQAKIVQKMAILWLIVNAMVLIFAIAVGIIVWIFMPLKGAWFLGVNSGITICILFFIESCICDVLSITERYLTCKENPDFWALKEILEKIKGE